MFRIAEVITNRISKIMSRSGLTEFGLKELKHVSRGAFVVSVGSGGESRKIVSTGAKEHGFQFKEIDVDPDRAPDLVADICETPFKAGSVDAVIILEVMEHVTQPDKAMKEIYRILKPNGIVIFSTPFLFPIHDAPHDYYRFTKHGIERLFSEFAVVSIREKMGWAQTSLVVRSRIARSFRGWRSLVAVPYALLLLVQWPFAAVVDRAFRSNIMPLGYFVVARKGGPA